MIRKKRVNVRVGTLNIPPLASPQRCRFGLRADADMPKAKGAGAPAVPPRTPCRSHTERTGYAYRPPACRTYLRHRAAGFAWFARFGFRVSCTCRVLLLHRCCSHDNNHFATEPAGRRGSARRRNRALAAGGLWRCLAAAAPGKAQARAARRAAAHVPSGPDELVDDRDGTGEEERGAVLRSHAAKARSGGKRTGSSRGGANASRGAQGKEAGAAVETHRGGANASSARGAPGEEAGAAVEAHLRGAEDRGGTS